MSSNRAARQLRTVCSIGGVLCVAALLAIPAVADRREALEAYEAARYGEARSLLEDVENPQGRDLLLDVDVQGAAQVREKMPEAVTVFVVPPSYEVLERRLRGRGQDDEATMKRRLAAAGRELRAFEYYDYAIVNDDLDSCVEALKSIVRAARCRVSHVAERARAIERTFETAKETNRA